MKLDMYFPFGVGRDGEMIEGRAGSFDPEPHRIEVPLEAPDGTQYKVIIDDAEDTVDVIIHYPDGEREGLFSLAKSHQS